MFFVGLQTLAGFFLTYKLQPKVCTLTGVISY